MNESLHHLFNKYLNDDCDEADIAALLLHFGIPANEGLLKGLIMAELERGQESFIPHDIDERVSAIHRRIQQQQQSEADTRRISPRRLFVRIAAAAVLLLAVAGFYWLARDKQATKPVVTAATPIHAGRNKAILTTSDGSLIDLTEAAAGALATEQGMSIRKTADGQIMYTQNGGKQTIGTAAYNTIQTPVGGQWHVVLPDQTRVWLNASSSLSYPVSFTGKERVVKLNGEAYFEVSPLKNSPFKVVTDKQSIAVLGTSFNVMAYAGDEDATTLLSGSVRVEAGEQQRTLVPGEQARLLNQQLRTVKDVDTAQVVAWKNGYFKFNGSLEEIMNQVARWYDVTVSYQRKPGAGTTFQGEISRSRDLQEVLHIIEYTGKVHFIVNERKITVIP